MYQRSNAKTISNPGWICKEDGGRNQTRKCSMRIQHKAEKKKERGQYLNKDQKKAKLKIGKEKKKNKKGIKCAEKITKANEEGIKPNTDSGK